MRVRVKFRYRTDTGEVEIFEVEDLHAGMRTTDHDARHDRAAADVAQIVESNALIEEIANGADALPEQAIQASDEQEVRRQRRHLRE